MNLLRASVLCCVASGILTWYRQDLDLGARCCHTVAFKILLVLSVVLGSNLLRMSPHVHQGTMLTCSMGICKTKQITHLAVFAQHFKDKKKPYNCKWCSLQYISYVITFFFSLRFLDIF